MSNSKHKILKLSASSINTFKKCPKQYHYRYIEKPDVEKQSWDFQEFGLCAHRTLELFHQDLMKKIREPAEYSIVMGRSFRQAIKEHNIGLLRDDLDALKAVIQDYLNYILRDGLPQVIATELNFDFMIGGYGVRGFIDRIDKLGPGEYHVVDYKTSKSDKYLTDLQLLLYALALQNEYPDAKIIHGSYLMLKHQSKLKSWSFQEADYERARQEVLNTGHDIDTNTFWEKKPSILCTWCDFKGICQDVWTQDED